MLQYTKYTYPEYLEFTVLDRPSFTKKKSTGRIGNKSCNVSKEYKEINAKRAKSKVRKLCLANSLFTHLVLTFSKNITDVAWADGEFKKFIKRLEYNVGSIKYVATREFQERGAIHYHVLINRNIFATSFNANSKLVSNFIRNNNITTMHKADGINLITSLWGHGFTKIKNHSNNFKAINYVIKYIAKETVQQNLVTKTGNSFKKYLCSKGLNSVLQDCKETVVITNVTKENSFLEMLDILTSCKQNTVVWDSTNTVQLQDDKQLNIRSVLIKF